MVKGIIFDFNGVLWWDSDLQKQAWVTYSTQVRGTPFTDEEIHTHVHGRNNQYTMEYLTGHEVMGTQLQDMIDRKEGAYRELCLAQGTRFALSPGAETLLDMIVLKNIPHTIATASEIGNLKFFFEHLSLHRWFDIGKVVYDDGTLPGKPAPDVYLRAAQLIGVTPEQCGVIEDAKSGIQAATNAHIGTIIALGPLAMHKYLLTLGKVSKTIETLDEVLPLI